MKYCENCGTRMSGVYSVAEVVDDSNKRPEKTIFCVMATDIDPSDGAAVSWKEKARKSLASVEKMVGKNDARVFKTLRDVAEFLNDHVG